VSTGKEIVLRIYQECLNRGRMELLEEIVAPDFVGVHDDHGPSGFARTLIGLRTAFPDIHYVIEDVIEEGDRVAVRFQWRGTHRAPFRGYAASGKTITDTGIAIYHLRDGKIVATWLETNRLGFFLEIGAAKLLPITY
jgi:steroid delta-isomerase-like uncharacterized protein